MCHEGDKYTLEDEEEPELKRLVTEESDRTYPYKSSKERDYEELIQQVLGNISPSKRRSSYQTPKRPIPEKSSAQKPSITIRNEKKDQSILPESNREEKNGKIKFSIRVLKVA